MLACALTLLMAAVMLTESCREERLSQKRITYADSLVQVAYASRDYKQILAVVDELESTGSLSEMKTYYWRGYAYSRLMEKRTAEDQWRKAVALAVRNEEDLKYYAKSANRLASMLLLTGDYGGTMTVATPAIKLMEKHDYVMNDDYINLQTFIGCCQLRLGREEEAADTYEQAYQRYMSFIDTDNAISSYHSAIIGIIAVADNYLLSNHYGEALVWVNRLDEMLKRYQRHPQATEEFADKQRARQNLYKASALEGLGYRKEAALAYQEASRTQYVRTGDGRMETVGYLISAKRWKEAADHLSILDTQMRLHNARLSLDNIKSYLLPKYRANLGARRIDSALVVGTRICDALDSAILWQKQDDAAELAVLYETQEKETQIARQQADLSRQRMIAEGVVLLLLTVFFILYYVIHRRSRLRLEQTNRMLREANQRAEESSQMKTNFIQQISHEIRTPLNILNGFTQVLTTSGIELSEKEKANMSRQIMQSTNRITGLVNKILELSDVNSRMELACTDTVTAVQIAAQACEDSGILTASHVDFVQQIAPEVETLELHTHRQSATRVLTLVLDNARKFTAPAESSHVDVGQQQKQRVTLRISASERYVTFVVEDTGAGIPAAESEHIFEEFVQLDEYYDGTGIGLSLARSLARRLSGDIVLDTDYTGGARFVFVLPRN